MYRGFKHLFPGDCDVTILNGGTGSTGGSSTMYTDKIKTKYTMSMTYNTLSLGHVLFSYETNVSYVGSSIIQLTGILEWRAVRDPSRRHVGPVGNGDSLRHRDEFVGSLRDVHELWNIEQRPLVRQSFIDGIVLPRDHGHHRHERCGIIRRQAVDHVPFLLLLIVCMGHGNGQLLCAEFDVAGHPRLQEEFDDDIRWALRDMEEGPKTGVLRRRREENDRNDVCNRVDCGTCIINKNQINKVQWEHVFFGAGFPFFGAGFVDVFVFDVFFFFLTRNLRSPVFEYTLSPGTRGDFASVFIVLTRLHIFYVFNEIVFSLPSPLSFPPS